MVYAPQKLIKKYLIVDIDTDGSYYYKTRNDVVMFTSSVNKDLYNIFCEYHRIISQGLFIIGNYFYFTYRCKKYWFFLSDSDMEYYYFNALCKDLESFGCSDILYDRGRYD